MVPSSKTAALLPLKRVRVWFMLISFTIAIFGLRLFYLQIIRYDHYKTAALSDQLKQYELPAARGVISAYDSGEPVPIVLNQTLYTIYADPAFVKPKKIGEISDTLVGMFGGNLSDYKERLTRQGSRYVILAKEVPKAKKDQLLKHEFAGTGGQSQSYRTYPQGQLAAQLLGFVDNRGKGVYGVEQALNDKLTGIPGQLKAITDVHGVPLAANVSNVSVPAQSGDDVQLTIDLGMQQQMEAILKRVYKETKSKGINAVIIDPYTGQIKAMSNYPTYNPAHHGDVKDFSVFKNGVVSNTIEPGSIMKPLTAAAALDRGAVTPTTTFYDPSHWLVDGFNITDIAEDGPAGQQSVQSTLYKSLNTGATWFLMRMGGSGTTVNAKGIDIWHDYMTNHYRLGHDTGVEQGYESAGLIPPTDPSLPARSLKFANTTFGQGVLITPLQMAIAYSSIINGGTLYKPTVVSSTTDASGKTTQNKPKVVNNAVVKPWVSKAMIPMMENIVTQYPREGFANMIFPKNYMIGGKTGTAQVAMPGGGYDPTLENGTYGGFIGGKKPQYVIVVYNVEPDVYSYSGSHAAMPVFSALAHMLIDGGYVTPK